MQEQIEDCDRKFTLAELKERAKGLGLSTSGDKKDLCRRIIEWGEKPPAYIPPTPPPKRDVTLPPSAIEALYGLQDEPSEYEWGGGLDFEAVQGIDQIERILAYYGERQEVPWQVIQKYGKDVEVSFHTHPKRARAGASKADIVYFINSPQQVTLIIARDEILILEKTLHTPKEMTLDIVDTLSSLQLGVYDPEHVEQKAKHIADTYYVEATLVPRASAVTFDLDVVRGIGR